MNMSLSITPQELVIIVAAQNQSPAVFNLEFLKYSGIIPSEWELARQPIYTPQVVQLAFQNSVVITAQAGRILFTETIESKDFSVIEIIQVARRCIQSLPNMEYEAVGINPAGHVEFDPPEATSTYLSKTLLADGPWQTIGQAAPRTRLSFTYTLERSPFNLTISEAKIRQADETLKPVIVFGGNFDYVLEGTTQPEKLQHLHQVLDHAQADLDTYQALINQNFLSVIESQPTLLPVFA
ncbi:hypothetical protein AB3R30_20070 [Leptolyngbyaceae cyanobacterium UHCC 1019]